MILKTTLLITLFSSPFTFTVWGQVVPEESSGKYVFTTGNIRLEVDPQAAGRISSLQLEGEEVLYTDKSSGDGNWGSIFWPSPQQSWGWPPPAALNEQPFSGSIEGNRVVLQSQIDGNTQLQVTNIYSADETDNSLNITYILTNKADYQRSLAPWEITRLPAGGLVFFPKGDEAPTGDLTQHVSEIDGIQWFDYNSLPIPGGVPKLFSDGSEGWQAHARSSGVLLLKLWEDVPNDSQAKNQQEREIEIYTAPDKPYYEMEQQGFYREIMAGDSIVWSVKWICRRIPESIEITAGNPGLLEFTRSQVLDPTAILHKPILTHPPNNDYSGPIPIGHAGSTNTPRYNAAGRNSPNQINIIRYPQN